MGSLLHNVKPNPDINEVSSCIEIITTEHTEAPKSIYDLVDEYKLLNSKFFKIGENSSSLYLRTNQKAK